MKLIPRIASVALAATSLAALGGCVYYPARSTGVAYDGDPAYAGNAYVDYNDGYYASPAYYGDYYGPAWYGPGWYGYGWPAVSLGFSYWGGGRGYYRGGGYHGPWRGGGRGSYGYGFHGGPSPHVGPSVGGGRR